MYFSYHQEVRATLDLLSSPLVDREKLLTLPRREARNGSEGRMNPTEGTKPTLQGPKSLYDGNVTDLLW